MTTDQCVNLFDDAHAAGMVAVNASYDKDNWWPCGFAEVVIRPANCKFAKWLVSEGKASKRYNNGGVGIWVDLFGQSMVAKETYARAFNDVVVDAGVKSGYNSRMD